MIHTRISFLNDTLAVFLPKKCGIDQWRTQLNGLGKLVWSTEDKNRYMHDQERSFIVREDEFDLQTCHLVERIRKQKVETGINNAVYTVECSWLGVGTTLTAGLLAMSVFEELEHYNISASDLNTNTEQILSAYWGIDRDVFGQNPQYNAFRISYSYTLPTLDRDDLMILEGLTDLD